VLWRVLHDTLILLHPFIPFVTEEIWHKLPGTTGSILRAQFPAEHTPAGAARPDPEAEDCMGLLIEVISGIRNVRGEMGIAPGLALDAVVHTADDGVRATLEAHREIIANLARLKSLAVTAAAERPKASATAVAHGITIYVCLEGIIDFAKETERLEKEIGKLSKELASVAKKLHNQDFLAKAPPEVVDKVTVQRQELLDKQQKIQANLEKIRSYDSAP
jgi:valyl-tRNA synthetase